MSTTDERAQAVVRQLGLCGHLELGSVPTVCIRADEHSHDATSAGLVDELATVEHELGRYTRQNGEVAFGCHDNWPDDHPADWHVEAMAELVGAMSTAGFVIDRAGSPGLREALGEAIADLEESRLDPDCAADQCAHDVCPDPGIGCGDVDALLAHSAMARFVDVRSHQRAIVEAATALRAARATYDPYRVRDDETAGLREWSAMLDAEDELDRVIDRARSTLPPILRFDREALVDELDRHWLVVAINGSPSCSAGDWQFDDPMGTQGMRRFRPFVDHLADVVLGPS